MGTSLSGLTPATTFDGLLKVGDNDPLTADLKAISTGDGADTILQLSDSALQIGGATTIAGVDDAYDTVGFEIQRNSGQYIFRTRNRGAIQMGSGIDWIEMNSNNNGIRLKTSSVERARITEIGLGIGETTPTSRLHVKGSGATSATTSLLVQNSAGSELFEIKDNGEILAGNSQFVSLGNIKQSLYKYLRSGNAFLYLSNTSGNMEFKSVGDYDFYASGSIISKLTSDGNLGIGETTPTARLHVKGSGNDNTTTSLLVQNSDAENIMAITDDGYLTYRTPQRELLTLGNGSVLKYGTNSSFSALYNRASIYDGTNTTQFENGNVGIGNGTTTPTARLQVKGSGATSATTALLVQNSAGDDMVKITDDSDITLSKLVTIRNSSAGLFARMYADGYGAGGPLMWVNGSVNLGSAPSTAAKLSVKGSGNDATTTALLVQNSDGADLLSLDDDGQITVGQTDIQGKINIKRASGGLQVGEISGEVKGLLLNGYDGTSVFIGRSSTEGVTINNGGFNHLGASLGVKGFGTTSATTALLVQNSAGTDGFWSKDDGSAYVRGNFGIGTPSPGQALSVIGTQIISGRITANGGITASNAQSTIQGSGTTSATTALLVQNSAGTEAFKVLDNGEVVVPTTSTFKVSSFSVQLGRIYPTTQDGDLGWNASTSYHFRNIYSKGVTHITDNTTSSTTLDASAKLQVDSTTQGFLPPRMTDAEKNAIATPAAGLMVYDTDANQMSYWNGSAWVNF